MTARNRPPGDAAREAHRTYPGTCVTGAQQNPHRHLKGTTSAKRYAASRRLPPLGPCGCIRDLLFDRHRCPPNQLSESMIDAGRDAALYLLHLGHTPILDPATLRGLRRRGGQNWQLATELAALTGGAVA